MNLIMVAIYDKLAKEYGPVNVVKNKAVAVRQFKGEVERMSPSARDDYELVELGEYDTETGQIINKEEKVIIEEDIENA